MKKRKQIHIPLVDMHISKANMRKERKAPIVDDILPSIESQGIISPLLVRKEGKGWGVVAGRRRWHCLKLIEKDNNTKTLVPCIVLEDDDEARAYEASLIENIGRLPPTEMQQYIAFGKLDSEGITVEEIAQRFGITELAVRRVLALANLDPTIRNLYAAEKISRETVKALTIASKAQQSEWLRLWKSKSDHAPEGVRCKKWVTGGASISTEHALFNITDYKGTVLDDLFGEKAYFADPELFWKSQNKALQLCIEALKSKGWKHVQILERGDPFYSYQYIKRAKTKGGKVYVEIRHSGEVLFHEGYITAAEDRKSRTDISAKPDKVQMNELTKPMAQYLGEHRRYNIIVDLLQKPNLALRLCVALMVQGSENFGLKEHKAKAMKQNMEASLKDSPARTIYESERKIIADLLVANGDCFTDHLETTQSYRLCRTFAVLLKMKDKEVLRCLTFLVSGSLPIGMPINEALSFIMTTDHAAHWSPDDVFFTLLRDKAVINHMLGEIGGKSLATAMLSESTRDQKEALVNRYRGHGVKVGVKDWGPRWMNTVPMGYSKTANNPFSEAWDQISGLFTKAGKKSAPDEKRLTKAA